MQRSRAARVLVLLLSLVAICRSPATLDCLGADFDAALKAAKADGKPIIIAFIMDEESRQRRDRERTTSTTRTSSRRREASIA